MACVLQRGGDGDRDVEECPMTAENDGRCAVVSPGLLATSEAKKRALDRFYPRGL